MQVELLMQVDHEVAVRSDALADLLQRLDHLRNARACVEQRSATAAALAAGSTARRRTRGRTRRRARPTGSRPTRARQDAAVYAVDAPAGRHRRRCALLEAHSLCLFLGDDPLRQTARRVQLDV